MTKIDTSKLRQSYIDAGGDQVSWDQHKNEMVEAARQQQAVSSALAEANRPLDLNSHLRDLARNNEGDIA